MIAGRLYIFIPKCQHFQISEHWAVDEYNTHNKKVGGSEGQKTLSDKRKVQTKEPFGCRPREGCMFVCEREGERESQSACQSVSCTQGAYPPLIWKHTHTQSFIHGWCIVFSFVLQLWGGMCRASLTYMFYKAPLHSYLQEKTKSNTLIKVKIWILVNRGLNFLTSLWRPVGLTK